LDCAGKSDPTALWNRLFLVEADLGFGRIGRRVQEGLELMPDNLKGFVVFEQRAVDFSQPLQDLGIGNDLFPHPNEGSDDVEAHCHGRWAVQNSRRHNGPVFGEGVG